MRWFKQTILILFLGIVLLTTVACIQVAAPKSSTPKTITTIAEPTPIPIVMPTQTTTLTLTTTATTTTTKPTVPASPSSASTTNPAEDRSFFTGTIVSGYDKNVLIDGTVQETPIYKELFFDLNLVGYYTPKDAIFVPRIPTITNQDDWFTRPQFPGYFLKSWVINWGYTVDKSKPAADITTVSLTIYPRVSFDANYYLHPDILLALDVKGDINPSSTGIHCKRVEYQDYTVIDPKEYVFLIRTNNAAAVSNWWIKVGTESKIINTDASKN